MITIGKKFKSNKSYPKSSLDFRERQKLKRLTAYIPGDRITDWPDDIIIDCAGSRIDHIICHLLKKLLHQSYNLYLKI